MLIFQRIATFFVGFAFCFCGLFMGSGFDSTIRYKQTIKDIPIYENTINTAVPQTEFYNYINDFFSTPSADGKVKKAIVIGYDGCRADTLQHLSADNESGINAVMAESDSQAFLTYCGGVNYPYINTQNTSTAPGWCAMLTGVWADKNLVDQNHIIKSDDYPTVLTSLVESKTIDASAFYVSWSGHFADSDATYISEKNYCETNNINVNFVTAADHAGTKQNVLNDLAKTDCSDFIFSIFESPDHEGHNDVFSPYNENFKNGFLNVDKIGYDIFNAVKARPTYENEDWLIIITADHGGNCFGHGNMTIMERMTFIVSNKELLK